MHRQQRNRHAGFRNRIKTHPKIIIIHHDQTSVGTGLDRARTRPAAHRRRLDPRFDPKSMAASSSAASRTAGHCNPSQKPLRHCCASSRYLPPHKPQRATASCEWACRAANKANIMAETAEAKGIASNAWATALWRGSSSATSPKSGFTLPCRTATPRLASLSQRSWAKFDGDNAHLVFSRSLAGQYCLTLP